MHQDFLLATAQISGALFSSLLMFIVIASFEASGAVWRAGIVLVVLYMLYGVSRAIREGTGGKNRLEPVSRHLLSVATALIAAFDIAIVAGIQSELAPFACSLSITLMIAVSVSYFIPLVLIWPET